MAVTFTDMSTPEALGMTACSKLRLQGGGHENVSQALCSFSGLLFQGTNKRQDLGHSLVVSNVCLDWKALKRKQALSGVSAELSLTRDRETVETRFSTQELHSLQADSGTVRAGKTPPPPPTPPPHTQEFALNKKRRKPELTSSYY